MSLVIGIVLTVLVIVAVVAAKVSAGDSRTRAAELAKAAEFLREHREALARCLDTPGVPVWLARAFLDLSDAFENRQLLADAIDQLRDGVGDEAALLAIRSEVDALAARQPRLRDDFEAMTYTGIMGNILSDAGLSGALRFHAMILDLEVRQRALRAASRALSEPLEMNRGSGHAMA